MTRSCLVGSILSACVSLATAAGIEALEIPATSSSPAIQAMVWTPCARTPEPINFGPFVLQGNRNCPVEGRGLPLVVISHGNRGTRFGHHDTAIALADAGFVAVSFNHPGNSFGSNDAEQLPSVFESRVTDTRRVIDFVTQQWDARGSIDVNAIGAFGFSRGGYTVLAMAGATPNVASSMGRFCSSARSWVLPLCWRFRVGNPTIQPRPDPRVKAIVSVDPLNLFDAAGLARVKVPVQLWASELGGDGVALRHVEDVKAGLPTPPEYHVAQGAGHFAFLAPCSPAFAKEAPEICNDRAGFDRVAFHRSMNNEVVKFFKLKLGMAPARP